MQNERTSVRSESRFRVIPHAILHPEVLITTLSNFNFATFDANTEKVKKLVLLCSLSQAFEDCIGDAVRYEG
jgi:hypothetical protein